MIKLSDVFNMIGIDSCCDVATSLAMQGTTREISIPIFDIFYLKILPSSQTQFIANSIPEANALRQLAVNCGGVSCLINILDMDVLTLAGVLCIYTPNTGMNIFFKNNLPNLAELADNIIAEMVRLAGIPVDLDTGFVGNDVAVKAFNLLFNKLVELISTDSSNFGISFRNWGDLPEYYEMLRSSGEMGKMRHFREITHAALI